MRRHVQLHAVSIRAAHVFFSCIRFTSIPLIESAAASSPPALRISNGGCGVVLIDCEAAAPKSAAIVCHVRQRFNDNYRAETPAYFSDHRSAPGTPAFRSNSFNTGNSTPVFVRTGSPTSDGGSPSHAGGAGLLDVLTLVAWRCKVRDSAQGFGCVRARCMFLQSTFKLCSHSACEAHGHGAQLQLLRCSFEQCSDSMLVCNAGAWMRVTSSFFNRCLTVARCVDRGSLVISSCALENVSHNAVLVTQASSFFCSSCSFKDVGLEYPPPPPPLFSSSLMFRQPTFFHFCSDAPPPFSLPLAVAAVCCSTQFFASIRLCVTGDDFRVIRRTGLTACACLRWTSASLICGIVAL